MNSTSPDPLEHFQGLLLQYLTESDTRKTDLYGDPPPPGRGSPVHLRDLTYTLDGALTRLVQQGRALEGLRAEQRSMWVGPLLGGAALGVAVLALTLAGWVWWSAPAVVTVPVAVLVPIAQEAP